MCLLIAKQTYNVIVSVMPVFEVSIFVLNATFTKPRNDLRQDFKCSVIAMIKATQGSQSVIGVPHEPQKDTFTEMLVYVFTTQ